MPLPLFGWESYITFHSSPVSSSVKWGLCNLLHRVAMKISLKAGSSGDLLHNHIVIGGVCLNRFLDPTCEDSDFKNLECSADLWHFRKHPRRPTSLPSLQNPQLRDLRVNLSPQQAIVSLKIGTLSVHFQIPSSPVPWHNDTCFSKYLLLWRVRNHGSDLEVKTGRVGGVWFRETA